MKNTDSPFAALANLEFPADPTASSPEVSPQHVTPPRRGPARAVVRLERKHRRGKEVTLIEKLGLSGAELDTWCRDLKRTLGCGGTVDQMGDGTQAIVLQGDFRRRLAEVLGKLGVQRVTISG